MAGGPGRAGGTDARPERPTRVGPPLGPLHVMVKPTGAICNLDCQYCFFLSKEELYPGSTFRMTPEVQEAFLVQLFAQHGPRDEVVIAYQGGEPTLIGLEFFERSVSLARELARPGQPVTHAIQTNGTLLDEQWGQFLAANDFLVGLSVDGPPEIHDRLRVDKGGKPTSQRVLRGWQVLVDHGVRWNALTTVNAANAEHGLAVYRYLRDELGAQFIQFIPVVERPPLAQHSVTGPQYGRFLVDAFEDWVRRDVGTVFVQLFDTALAHWLGLGQAGLCVHAETCGRALALEHTGDLYSCDHFVSPEYLLGNITQTPLGELAAGPEQREFGTAKRDTLPRYCLECPVKFACNGGCPKDRFGVTPDGEPGLNVLCAGYRQFFGHIDPAMRVMAESLRRGGLAEVVMAWAAAGDATRGRNDPCTCGSGRKWKRCHGTPTTAAIK